MKIGIAGLGFVGSSMFRSFKEKHVDVVGYDKSSYIYDLYGICNHSGNVLGGHYWAYVKNANSKWYNFNDTMVREINPSQLITANAYCLFYRKKY